MGVRQLNVGHLEIVSEDRVVEPRTRKIQVFFLTRRKRETKCFGSRDIECSVIVHAGGVSGAERESLGGIGAFCEWGCIAIHNDRLAVWSEIEFVTLIDVFTVSQCSVLVVLVPVLVARIQKLIRHGFNCGGPFWCLYPKRFGNTERAKFVDNVHFQQLFLDTLG
ncbi:hypothetical protein EBX93_11800 [bacterium]|nr:hypothetical protein [bacterium]